MTAKLPEFVPWRFVHQRLQQIFVVETEGNNYCTREMAGKTVFAMLYVAAVEGTQRCLAPKHIYRMTDEQAGHTSDEARLSYGRACLEKGYSPSGQAWFADNSREPIRDETIRQGLARVGAVLERTDLAKTSAKPRYSLARDFVALFDPALNENALAALIDSWRMAHLKPEALHRLQLVQAAGEPTAGGAVVRMPDSSTRTMSAGQSSIVTKAIIEVFAPRFLVKPHVLFISESGQKVVAADIAIAKKIGLLIDQASLLPDVVLVDLGADAAGFLLVFVEVVHSDGPISEQRREQLIKLAKATKLDPDQVVFVTAYMDRSRGPAKSHLARIAWNSFIWFVSEPDNIVAFFHHDGHHPTLRALIGMAGAR